MLVFVFRIVPLLLERLPYKQNIFSVVSYYSEVSTAVLISVYLWDVENIEEKKTMGEENMAVSFYWQCIIPNLVSQQIHKFLMHKVIALAT
jgi:hypothetical protein